MADAVSAFCGAVTLSGRVVTDGHKLGCLQRQTRSPGSGAGGPEARRPQPACPHARRERGEGSPSPSGSAGRQRPWLSVAVRLSSSSLSLLPRASPSWQGTGLCVGPPHAAGMSPDRSCPRRPHFQIQSHPEAPGGHCLLRCSYRLYVAGWSRRRVPSAHRRLLGRVPETHWPRSERLPAAGRVVPWPGAAARRLSAPPFSPPTLVDGVRAPTRRLHWGPRELGPLWIGEARQWVCAVLSGRGDPGGQNQEKLFGEEGRVGVHLSRFIQGRSQPWHCDICVGLSCAL